MVLLDHRYEFSTNLFQFGFFYKVAFSKFSSNYVLLFRVFPQLLILLQIVGKPYFPN